MSAEEQLFCILPNAIWLSKKEPSTDECVAAMKVLAISNLPNNVVYAVSAGKIQKFVLNDLEMERKN